MLAHSNATRRVGHHQPREQTRHGDQRPSTFPEHPLHARQEDGEERGIDDDRRIAVVAISAPVQQRDRSLNHVAMSHPQMSAEEWLNA